MPQIHGNSPESHAAVPWYRRIQWWGWVLIGLCTVIAVFAGTFGIQAMSVKKQETQAIDTVKSAVASGEVDKLPNALADMQQHTRKANETTHNGLWNFVATWPGIGNDIHAVQELTQIVDDIAQDVAPQYADIGMSIMSSELLADGTINIEPITSQYANFVSANDSLILQLDRIDSIEEPSINVVKDLVDQARSATGLVEETLKRAQSVVLDLPQYLGFEQPQTYAIMAMTPAEMRISGGLIGAIGTLTLDRGAFEIGNFRTNLEYVEYGGADVDADTQRLFKDEGPLYMSYDVRDLANYPTTQGTAEAFRSIWGKTPWGKSVELDGVILVDPVVVQTLVQLTGDIVLPNGTVLNGDNTAQFLMNTVYTDYSVLQGDEYFGVVAEECAKALTSTLNPQMGVKLIRQLLSLARHRHCSAYSFDPSLEELLKDMGLSATVPTDESHPTIGIYLTEQNPSKMGWYVERSAEITRICTDGAPDKYHVKYTLHNTLAEDMVGKLGWYVTGALPYNEGASLDKILFYPPYGGEISNFTVEGTASTPQMDTLNAAVMYRSLAQIRPEQTVTYSFDVTTSKKAASRLAIDQTPTYTEEASVKYLNSCRVG